MKRGKTYALTLFAIIFLVIILSDISAISLTLSKDDYYPEEIIQAEITGDFITLKNENMVLYREGTPRAMPVISDLTKQGDIYYFYAILPKQEGNYSLEIKGSEYIDNSRLKTETIIKEFEIKEANQSLNQTFLSINPGFVVTNKEFSIKIKSLNKNAEINAELEATHETKDISLIKDIEKTIDFLISGAETGKTNLKIEDYNIPVFIIQKTNDSFIPEKTELNFIPSELKGTIISGENYFFKILIENSGEKNLTNISLSTDLNAIIQPNLINLIEKNQKIVVNATLSVPEKEKNEIIGEIKAKFDDKEVTLPIFFEITKNIEEVSLNGTSIESLSCADIGDICIENEKCDGEITASLQGSCCRGSCIEIKQTNYSFYIGIILLILIIGFIAYSYMKIRKKQKLKSPEQILREKSDKYKQRMKGENSEEVSGKLGAV